MRRSRALFGPLLLVFVSSFAFADVEIIVTASRIEEDARSAPAYVRVIPEEEIRDGRTVLDALKKLPDISVKDYAPGMEYVAMGGFGENGQGRVLVLVDGRPMNRPDMSAMNWHTIPLDRIERIEVVKGPLSSQYGDQAVAGVINIITKDPEGLEAWARTRITTDLSNSQAAGAALGEEDFHFEIGASREALRPSRDRSDSDTLSANFSMGGNLGELSLDFDGFLADSRYELPGDLTEAEYEADPDQATDQADEVREKTYETALEIGFGLGDFDAAVPLSWLRVDRESDNPSYITPTYTHTVLDTLRAGFQADGSLLPGENLALSPTAGIDAAFSRIEVSNYADVERTSLSSREDAWRVDGAAWARSKALIGENWSADAGVRTSFALVAVGNENKAFFPVVFDAGASWLPRDEWTFGLRYGRVFRYPFLDEQSDYSYASPAGLNEDLDPETGHQVNLSAEYRKGGFSASMSPYFLAMADEIAADPVTWENRNIGATYHFGGVVSSSWEIGPVDLRAAYSYDRAQFKDSGKIVPLVPAHSVSGGIVVNPLDILDLSTDAEYTSKYYRGGDSDNAQAMISGRIVWNCRVELRPIEDLSIYAAGRNLLDDRTPTYVYYTGWYPSRGRTFDFGVDWRY